METIDSLRLEIDQVHKDIQALLLRRRDLAMAIWRIKQEQDLPFYSAEREDQIISDFLKLDSGAKDKDFEVALRVIMTTILREFEKYLRIHYP